MKAKELICALSDGLRFYTLSVLQVLLSILLLPALLLVIVVLWIEDIKE